MLMVARNSVEIGRFRRIRIPPLGSFVGPTDDRSSFEDSRAAGDGTGNTGPEGLGKSTWHARNRDELQCTRGSSSGQPAAFTGLPQWGG
jgi:hypothetical protein